MSSIEKLKTKFYKNPVPKDITMSEITRLAEHYGCLIRTGGNHQISIHNPKTGDQVPLPQHSKEVKTPYIKELRMLFNDEEQE